MQRIDRRSFLWVGILLVVLSACNSQDICLSNQHAAQIKLVSLYTTTSTTDKDTTLTVSVWGIGRTDSVYSSQSLSSLFLPLKFDGDPDTTSFILKLNTSIDTIYMVHRKELDFVSGDCGYVFRFEIDTVWFTHNTLDSVSISHPIIKYGEDATNIKLFVY
ncbi:MAG: DUF6452 family protein [Breznakibacter sp.]